MTAPDAADSPTPDFTVRRAPIPFTIAPDTFVAPPMIGGFMLRKLAGLHAQLGDVTAAIGSDGDAVEKLMTVMADMFMALLPGAAGRRFAERLLSDGNPGDPDADPPVPASPPMIGLMDEAMPALYYLLERYGLRPTVPSSPSPAGSTDGRTDIPSDGTSSTDGASDTASPRPVSTLETGLI
jgi:hypothetical protein